MLILCKKFQKKGGGGYHVITANNTDLNTVLKKATSNGKHSDKQNQIETDDFKSDDWKSNGPYLLLLLLPIAALAFRKGWLLNLFLAIGLAAVFVQPDVVYAEDAAEHIVDKNSIIETAEEPPSFIDSVSEQWQKLWLNSEQRADRAFKQKQYQQASQLSEAPLRKGSASYKSNDYKAALNAFQKAQGADARYNQGNTLAKMEKYKEAIESYKKALEVSPDMEDAKINKKAVEDFLKKKKQEKKNQKEGQKKGDKNKKDKGKKSGKKGEGKGDAKENQEGDKEGGDKNQFAKANKDLDKKKKTDKQKQANEEKEAEEKASKAKKAGQDKKDVEKAQDENKAKAIKAAKAKAEELSKEEKMAAEQWLRRIPDDPGGLLRRKFRRQYQRNNRRPNDDEQPW